MLFPILALTGALFGPGAEPLATKVAAVDLFKNGLAVVRRTGRVTRDGTYRLADVPAAVHGTFWIGSDVKIAARTALEEREEPWSRGTAVDFQSDLVGRSVTIFLRDGRIPPATGRVLALGEKPGTASPGAHPSPYGMVQPGAAPGPFLVLATDKGRVYVDRSMIAYVSAAGAKETVRRKRPVLYLQVEGVGKEPATVHISYLARGLAWAPSYRLDIIDDRQLKLAQKAVVRNELMDLEDTAVTLISGFPSIRFGRVTTLLDPTTTWTRFLAEVAGRTGRGDFDVTIAQAAAIVQNVASNDPQPGSTTDLTPIAAGRGVDLHFQEVGRRTLARGEALLLPVADGTTPYERLVEWIIPDTRQADGRIVGDYQRRQDPERYEEAAWDALRFRNPLPFPMTTAPAMVVDRGRFNGQRTTGWVAVGEKTTLRITKALNLRTRAVEVEEAGARDHVYRGGNRYRQTTVRGDLALTNHRAEKMKILVRRRFSGELVEAEQSPGRRLLEEGVWSVNPRQELTWEFDLEAGATVKILYRYRVLVRV